MHRLKKYLPFLMGGIVLLGVLIALAVWNNRQTPEWVLNRYMQYVNEGRYEAVYDELLSDKAKSYTDRQTFIDQYRNIYGGIEARNIKMSNLEKSDESTDNYTYLKYDYEMDTVAGHYMGGTSARITKKPGGWAIEWNEGMLIPGFSKWQTVSVVPAKAERGSIYDRNGNLLAGKGEVLEVGIVPGKLSAETRDADLQTMAALLGMKTEDIQSKLSQSWVTDDVRVPVTTLDEKDTALEVQLLGIAGIYTDTTEVRTYPYGEKASQLTGYVQGISAEELEARGDEGYTESSVIGKTGLEAAFENRLRGKDGCKILVDQGGVDNYQDAAGNWIQRPRIWTLAEDPAEKGEDITVTIDASIQTRLYDAFASDKSGSVAMNPKTGEVLVNPVHMASAYSAFVNGGSMVKPVLEYSGTPQFWYLNAFSKEAADTIRHDLIQVVENPAGTAHEAHMDGVTLAGKTGTAEIKASQEDTGGTEIGWFNAFIADPDSPEQLLVVSMVEDVKERGGSHYLVPKVRNIF